MSSESSTPPAPETKKTKPARTRREKWRRRVFVGITAIVVLTLLFRIVLHALFPVVLDRVARGYGLTATYDKLDLQLLGGDVGLWGLSFKPVEGGDPVLTSSYCRGAISVWKLFQFKLHVERVEAEESQVVLERLPDGSMPLVEKLIGNAAKQTPTATSQTQATLDPPLRIDALRLQNAKARLRDKMVSPATDVTLQLNLLAQNIADDAKPIRVEMQLFSKEALAALYVDATLDTPPNQLKGKVDVRMTGLDLTAARAYLAPLGITPIARDISARATGDVTLALVDAQTGTTLPTNPQKPMPSKLTASLSLRDIDLTAASLESAGVKAIRADVTELSPGAIRVREIAVEGVQANATRTEAGKLRFAGLDFGSVSGGASADSTSPAPTAASAAKSVAATQPASALPIIEVADFHIRDVQLHLTDATITPTHVLALNVPAIEVKHLSTDPAQAATPATFTLRAEAPGIARSVAIDGQIAAASATKRGEFAMNVEGLTAAALSPYLNPLGISPSLKDGRFTCRLIVTATPEAGGALGASLKLTDAVFADGEADLFAMPLVSVDGARFEPAANAIVLTSIELTGPSLPLARDHDGTLRAFGFALKPVANVPAVFTSDASAATSALPTTRSANTGLSLPSLQIGSLTWGGTNIRLRDAVPETPVEVRLDDVTATIKNLKLGTADSAGTPGTIAFSMKSPGVVESVAVDGTAWTTRDHFAFDLNAKADAITLERLKTFLGSLNLEPTFTQGKFTARASGSVGLVDGVLVADLSADKVALANGDETLLGVDRASVGGLRFDGQSLSIDKVGVVAPRATIDRDDLAQLGVAGLKLLTPPPSKTVSAAADAASPTRLDLTLPFDASIGTLSVEKASVRLRDTSVLPTADVTATVDATLSKFVVGKDAPASSFSVSLTSPGVVGEMKIDGALSAAPHRQSIEATLVATGLTGETLAGYLPPTLGLNFVDGTAKGSLRAEVSPNEAGGSAASLVVSDAALTSSNHEDAALGELKLVASRVDLPGKVIAIDELSTRGVRAAVSQDDAGLHFSGVTLAPKALRESPPSRPTAEPVAATGASDVNALVSQAKATMPTVSLNKLSLALERVSFAAPALGRPLAVSGVSLTNGSPLVIGGEDPTIHPPMQFALLAKIDDLIGAVKADAWVAPFAAEPMANFTLTASELKGSSLGELVPAVKDLLAGADLDGATFSTASDARFNYTRRGALGIDLTRDVTGDINIHDTKLVSPGNDRPVFGVAAVRGEKLKFSPATGSISAASLDIEKPLASVIRDKDGIHVLGLTLKVLQPTSGEATTQPGAPPTETTTPAETVVVAETPATPQTMNANPAESTAEMKIDRLTVTGVDFLIEDRANTPTTSIPVTNLDVEVTGLSTRALTEPRPIRFSAVAGSGKVPLPPRKPKAGQGDEARDVFAEASATGNLTLVPKPKGYVRASLSGLEMTAVRGIAQEFGITLGGGTFDARLDVRMQGADTFDAKVWPTFNELRMSEVKDGPVQSTFKLPAPPDVVIATIEDADGSLTFPVTVPIEAGNVKTGPIVASAIGSVGKVIAEAMIAAPLKAGKLVGGLLGQDMTSERVKGLEPVVIEFVPGETQLSDAQIDQLIKARDLMRRDVTIEATIQQELGEADVERAQVRINPQNEDAAALADRFRTRKFELQRQATDQTAALRVAEASQNTAEKTAATERLRSTTTELKLTEDGLDEMLNLLKPGADRQAPRRTKAAAILLADLRLRTVQDWFLAANLKDGADRIRKGNATFNPKEDEAATQPDQQPRGTVKIVLTRRAKS